MSVVTTAPTVAFAATDGEDGLSVRERVGVAVVVRVAYSDQFVGMQLDGDVENVAGSVAVNLVDFIQHGPVLFSLTKDRLPLLGRYASQ
jgi:hypothetical protein